MWLKPGSAPTGPAHITLIERVRAHFRTPHRHEIATGRKGLRAHATDHLAPSHRHGLRYGIGEMARVRTTIATPGST
jgi:hypothetical protein